MFFFFFSSLISCSFVHSFTHSPPPFYLSFSLFLCVCVYAALTNIIYEIVYPIHSNTYTCVYVCVRTYPRHNLLSYSIIITSSWSTVPTSYIIDVMWLRVCVNGVSVKRGVGVESEEKNKRKVKDRRIDCLRNLSTIKKMCKVNFFMSIIKIINFSRTHVM